MMFSGLMRILKFYTRLQFNTHLEQMIDGKGWQKNLNINLMLIKWHISVMI